MQLHVAKKQPGSPRLQDKEKTGLVGKNLVSSLSRSRSSCSLSPAGMCLGQFSAPGCDRPTAEAQLGVERYEFNRHTGVKHPRIAATSSSDAIQEGISGKPTPLHLEDAFQAAS